MKENQKYFSYHMRICRIFEIMKGHILRIRGAPVHQKLGMILENNTQEDQAAPSAT